MMLEENLARLRAHRNNIHRYRRLLATQLSEMEREFILKRLDEEKARINALAETTFPFTLPVSQAGLPACKSSMNDNSTSHTTSYPTTKVPMRS
jgi:hypothetical protein